MRTTACRSAGSRSAWAALAALGAMAECAAGTLEISVVDDEGRPIEQVAVYASLPHTDHGVVIPNAAAAGEAPTAIMDQHDHQFVPHMLVVQAGTSVLFPNSDDVSHHVYSFSPAKTFELGLYKGDKYPPVVFDQPGIVVVGCNIHDGMLGYVRVVETPYFALTNERGVAIVDGVPSGRYAVEVWTPRVRPAQLPAAQQVDVAADTAAVDVRISGRLAPPHAHGASSLTWERY
jgi:plastocyanin